MTTGLDTMLPSATPLCSFIMVASSPPRDDISTVFSQSQRVTKEIFFFFLSSPPCPGQVLQYKKKCTELESSTSLADMKQKESDRGSSLARVSPADGADGLGASNRSLLHSSSTIDHVCVYQPCNGFVSSRFHSLKNTHF